MSLAVCTPYVVHESWKPETGEHGYASVKRIRYCYKCGTPVPRDTEACDACGGMEFDEQVVRPSPLDGEEPSIPLPGPWNVVQRWPESTVLSITGGPGTGKSTLVGMLRPDLWMTAEQTPRRAVVTLVRSQHATPETYERVDIAPIRKADDVERRLRDVESGLVALDSLTRAGSWDTQVEILEAMNEWAQSGPDRRVVAILQYNKRGEAAGLNAVEHLVDFCLDAYKDPSGLRVLSCWKNRSGEATARYFKLDEHGVGRPKFEVAAYSVEGDKGEFVLHPWPMKGAIWSELLDVLFGRRRGRNPTRGVAVPGIAGCGLYQPGYERNVLEPADVDERRRFAEEHGLTWWSDRWKSLPEVPDHALVTGDELEAS